MDQDKPKKSSFRSSFDAAAKKRLLGLVIALLALGFAAYKLYRPSDPLAELKRTEPVTLGPAAKAEIDKALALIAEHKYGELYKMMRVKDSIAFQVNYTNGIFRDDRSEFAPAKITGEPRKLVHSSWENVFVLLHSEPRNENYWISLVKNNGRYVISEIIDAKVIGKLK